MTISQRSFFHGAVLAEITYDNHFTSINKIPSVNSTSAYQINHNKGIYVKYTTSPTDSESFRFTFSDRHLEEIEQINNIFSENTFIILVCDDDGICILDYDMLTTCIEIDSNDSTWVEIFRPAGGSYRARGPKGNCERSIPLNSFPQNLFN